MWAFYPAIWPRSCSYSGVFPSTHRPTAQLHSRFQQGASCLSASSNSWPQRWAGPRRSAAAAAADGGLLAWVAGFQASSRIGSLQGADLLLEIPAALGALGALEAGTELGAQPLRLPIS